VKLAKKGKLGDVLYKWSKQEYFTVLPTIIEEVGSIQISCTTIPYDKNVSIFFFNSGKIKICGGILDPCTAGIKLNPSLSTEEIAHDYTILDSSVQTYLNEVKGFVCDMLGVISDSSTFVPGLINGQFELGMHIQHINKLSLLASSEMKDLFSYVRGQEPEINGRRYAVQMFLNSKLHISFDHFGKVQIFCAKSFMDMVLCWKSFIDMITRALDVEKIVLSDIEEKVKKIKKGKKV
jgi:hypothetical protein